MIQNSLAQGYLGDKTRENCCTMQAFSREGIPGVITIFKIPPTFSDSKMYAYNHLMS